MGNVRAPLVENEVNSIKLNRGYYSNVDMKIGGSAVFDMSASSGTFKFPSGAITGQVQNIIDSTAATLTLTAAQSGSVVLMDRAAGTTITLPAPVVGLNFTFIVNTSVTSNNHKVITDAGTTLILGGVAMVEAADTNSGLGALFNGTTHISILMNGTTTGGLIGTQFTLDCITATQWAISGVVAGSGTLATCASTS